MLNYIKLLFVTLSLSFASYMAVAEGPAPLSPDASKKVLKIKTREALVVGADRPSDPAKRIIHAIVGSVGLKPNFEIRQANIFNAAAVNHKGKRYILYDAKFMKGIQQATRTDWAAVSILAHEIGHHLNGHTIMGKGHSSREQELEADEFSGFVLRQMGASLEDAQKALRVMVSEDGSASHPGKAARMDAIEKGYISADERILAFTDQLQVNKQVVN